MQFLWFIISILNLSLWQVPQVHGEDPGLLGASSLGVISTHNGGSKNLLNVNMGVSSMSSSGSSISSSGSNNHNFNTNNINNNLINNINHKINNNNNNNMNVNSTMLNTILGSNKGSISSAGGVGNSMASVMSSGLGLNSLSGGGAASTSLSALGPVGGAAGGGGGGVRDMNGVKSSIGGGSLPSHGHALAGLANLGIIVPGVGGLSGTGTRPYNSLTMGSTMDMNYGTGQTSNYEHYISEHTVMAVFTLQGQVDGPCRYMPATRRQKHQCRKEFGLPETIREARRLATTHCEDQFRYERWNCTIETRGKRNIFKKLYKETAFVHALTAAAMTHSIARACAEGRMTKCSCGPRKQNRVDQDFQWGGCNDNLKHGKRVTRSFLDLHVRDGDEVTEILRHDSEVGIEAVSTLMKDKCKCHGVSGSCSMKTCWKKLSDFNATTTLLRQKYNQAIRKATNIRTIRESPMNRMKRPKQRRKKQQPQYTTLYYLETSPTYCSITKDRQCLHPDNCANLCCGRGYTTRVYKQVEKCRCRFNNGRCCQLICDYCQRYEDKYFCK